jgi:threonine synthase
MIIKNLITLGAINSINWARIMCQITYYFYSASRIENSENIVYSVPTGNFGDILAGYISKKMGLKFKKLNIATNENNILDIALKSGEHTIKDVVSTSSPSIDIQVSSNFERLVYDSCKDSSLC